MLQTNTRSHHKPGTEFEQIHPTGSWSLWCAAQTEPHGSAQSSLDVLDARASAPCRPCRVGAGSLQRHYGPVCAQFSPADLRTAWRHPMLQHRASIGLWGLLTWALLWANMAKLFISHSWQWKKLAVFSVELESAESQPMCRAVHCITNLCCKWTAHGN